MYHIATPKIDSESIRAGLNDLLTLAPERAEMTLMSDGTAHVATLDYGFDGYGRPMAYRPDGCTGYVLMTTEDIAADDTVDDLLAIVEQDYAAEDALAEYQINEACLACDGRLEVLPAWLVERAELLDEYPHEQLAPLSGEDAELWDKFAQSCTIYATSGEKYFGSSSFGWLYIKGEVIDCVVYSHRPTLNH